MNTVRMAIGLVLLAAPTLAIAQSIGFDAPGGTPMPINITAQNGIAWNQKNRTVTAIGEAKAIRGKVTVTADRLIAHYTSKSNGPKPGDNTAKTLPKSGTGAGFGGLESGASQISELDAVGHVHIFTKTDQALGDRAVYHMARHEMVLTGSNLRLTTPTETVTAGQEIQYWSAEHKAVAIGDAKVTSKDGRSVAADRLTGYFTADAAKNAAASAAGGGDTSKLRKVIAEGHVVVRTQADVVTGDHGVYHPATGIAILTGNVHITRGPNELAGEVAHINMKTGIATLASKPGQRVQGMVIPDSAHTPPAGAAPKLPQSGTKRP